MGQSMTRRRALQTAAAIGAATGLGACAAGDRGEVNEEQAASTSNTSDFMDGVATAAAIRRGEMTAQEAVNAAIARAEAVNPEINAIATKTFENARELAGAALAGPFAGVPTFIKDLEPTRGEQLMYGSRAFRGYVPEADGPMAAKWRAAGLVSLGKSTTPEMGLTSSTEPLVTGATRNPWDLSRIPGGSSGGAAALTAARVVPFAHASDGGGSIRIPAACCGLFGLKPSIGRIGARERANLPVDLSAHHAVTWTVRDSAALFAATENGSYPELGVVSEPISRRLRIGFAPEPMTGAALDPQVRAGVEAAAQLCTDLGHEVSDFTMPFDEAVFTDAFTLYWATGAAEFAQSASRFTGKPIGPDILEPVTLGLATVAAERQADLPGAIAYLQGFEAMYETLFEDIDILLSPTVTQLPPAIGAFDPAGEFDEVFGGVMNYVGYTPPMNAAGAASMSVPLFNSPDGLPIGIMFSGKRGDDGLLLALALELEAAAPWIDRVPPLLA